jgi:putative spermidine/putrescine transport system ATP-binding protein
VTGGAPLLAARDVRFAFGSTVALDGLSLDATAGEIVSLIGPNGCGKSTFLRVAAGLLRPDAGSVTLEGAPVRGPDARIGLVFQEPRLLPWRSVADNVTWPLELAGWGRERRAARLADLIDLVGLEGTERRRPAQLSGGQRQRVALARALVNRPRVLLLDEPLGALDLKLREQMQVELKGIQRDVGITFLFVTHDQEEALTLSDRIAVFNAGRIEQVGTAHEVYESPASAFVAGFVGTSNLLTGEAARAVNRRDGSFAIRPEKLAVAAWGSPAADGLASAEGTLEEVVYGGPVTRFVVTLDAGGRLTALEQNAGTRPDTAALRRGDRVSLRWRPEHVIDVPGAPTPEPSSLGTSPQQFPTR